MYAPQPHIDGAHNPRSRQNPATLRPLRACSETNLCHFRRAFLLRSRCVIAPASSPASHNATLPHTQQDALHISLTVILSALMVYIGVGNCLAPAKHAGGARPRCQKMVGLGTMKSWALKMVAGYGRSPCSCKCPEK